MRNLLDKYALKPGIDVYEHDPTKHIYPYDQGIQAAKSDFGWCSMNVRKGMTDYQCADSDYAKEKGKTKHAKAWREGYYAYFEKQNKKPRKKQVPLPGFY